MNRMKYRVCLLVVLVIAIIFGVWFYKSGYGKTEEPFAGATLVWLESAEISV